MVSRPKEFHRESLAEPYVTLSRHTAPVIQPVALQLANGRTALGRHLSSCQAISHCAAFAAALFCISVWPSVPASDQGVEKSRPLPSDRTPHSNSTIRVLQDWFATPDRLMSLESALAASTHVLSAAFASTRHCSHPAGNR